MQVRRVLDDSAGIGGGLPAPADEGVSPDLEIDYSDFSSVSEVLNDPALEEAAQGSSHIALVADGPSGISTKCVRYEQILPEPSTISLKYSLPDSASEFWWEGYEKLSANWGIEPSNGYKYIFWLHSVTGRYELGVVYGGNININGPDPNTQYQETNLHTSALHDTWTRMRVHIKLAGSSGSFFRYRTGDDDTVRGNKSGWSDTGQIIAFELGANFNQPFDDPPYPDHTQYVYHARQRLWLGAASDPGWGW